MYFEFAILKTGKTGKLILTNWLTNRSAGVRGLIQLFNYHHITNRNYTALGKKVQLCFEFRPCRYKIGKLL